MTLLMYSITIRKTKPVIVRTAMRPPRIAGSTAGQPCCRKWCEGRVECGKPEWKLNPPEPNSPASSPTIARRAHCPKRNGCKSCRFVCSKANVTVSMAEIGNRHLEKIVHQQGTANQVAEQINSFATIHLPAFTTEPCRRAVRLRTQSYSYRRASTGSSLDARMAGTRPLITPTTSKTALERMTVITEMRR